MSSAFVLAPVPPAARRRRANSRSSPSTNFVEHSRSGSSTSCSSAPRTRSRSRRPSLRHAPRRSPNTPSASFINFVDSPLDAKYITTELLKSPATPPSYEQIDAHLHVLGYQTGFLDTTNQSPLPILRRLFFKSRPSTPQVPAHKELPVPPVPKIPAPAIPKTPKTKKPKKQSKPNVRPTMYAQDVQLAIFFDGGKEKDHVARAAAKTTTKGTSSDKDLVASGREVGGYKDEKGMLWWDETEQWEWAALLPKDGEESTHQKSEWVDFEGEFERRSSASSAYSDKSVEALMDELEELLATSAGVGAGGRLGGVLPPRSVLAMPRPRTRGLKGQGAAYLFPIELTQKNDKPVFSPSATSFGARRAMGPGRRRRAGPPPPLTLTPPSPFGTRTGTVVVGVVGPIASAHHFKHSHNISFDDSFVTREAEFAWAALVNERAPPKSARLPKKSGKVAGMFKGFGRARKQGTF